MRAAIHSTHGRVRVAGKTHTLVQVRVLLTALPVLNCSHYNRAASLPCWKPCGARHSDCSPSRTSLQVPAALGAERAGEGRWAHVRQQVAQALHGAGAHGVHRQAARLPHVRHALHLRARACRRPRRRPAGAGATRAAPPQRLRPPALSAGACSPGGRTDGGTAAHGRRLQSGGRSLHAAATAEAGPARPRRRPRRRPRPASGHGGARAWNALWRGLVGGW